MYLDICKFSSRFWTRETVPMATNVVLVLVLVLVLLLGVGVVVIRFAIC